MTRPDLTLAREFDAALAWWQAAGVDCDFADDATAWLADEPAPDVTEGGAAAARPARGDASQPVADRKPSAGVTAPTQPPRAERRDLLGDSPPSDLPAFRDWWLSAPALGRAHAFPRIAPRGAAGAALMVLVPHPEADDRDTLLSGPQGRLLDNIIGAMGLDDAAVYRAAALPCHTPMADLASLAAGGMDAVTAHHITLVRPARLLVLGTGLSPMLGLAGEHPLREINYTACKVPAMSCETLDALMDMPRLKARFWRRWMEWSATN